MNLRQDGAAAPLYTTTPKEDHVRPAQFSVSLMCMDFMDVGSQLEILDSRANAYHMDVMDGHFAPNITLSPDFVSAIGKRARLPMEVHLMTEAPNQWLEQLAGAGAETLSVHAETITRDTFRTLNRIQNLGCQVGLVLNPGTPLNQVSDYLSRIDLLTLMTVDVGFAGQPFIPEVLDKIKEAADRRDQGGFHYAIQVDGSCNGETFGKLRDAGAEIFILGNSGLFNLDADLTTAWEKMIASYQRATGEQLSG